MLETQSACCFTPKEHDPDDPKPPGCEMIDGFWWGLYVLVRLTVDVPGGSDYVEWIVWYGDAWYIGEVDPYGNPINPYPPTVTETGDANAQVTITVSNLAMKEYTTDASPSNRGFLWFGDRTGGCDWYAVDDSTVSVVAVCDVDTISLSANLTPGQIGAPICAGTIEADYAVEELLVWAEINNWSLDGTALAGAADLYYPGTGVAPDPTYNADWKRAGSAGNDWRVGNGYKLWSETATMSGASCLRNIGVPRKVTFAPATGKHLDDTPYTDIEVSGTPIEWVEDPPGTFTATPIPFSGEYAVYEGPSDNSRYHYEWRKFNSEILALNVTTAWREANGEDVDRNDPEDEDYPKTDQDDVKVALLIHPLDATSLGGNPNEEWDTFFTITPEGNIGVVKPSGVSRPANWVGSGGLTPDGGNNDLWTVAAASSAPTATLTLAERFTSRMTRMFDHADDSPYDYHSEIGFYYNRANPPTAIAEVLDPPAGRVPENIWHWKNRGAGRLDITAPKDGTIKLTVNYKVPVFDFPWTTNAGYNWGLDSPSELDWETGQVSWDIAVVTGVNAVSFDLMLPKTGAFDPQLHVVTSVSLLLPASVGEEQWTFSEITLLPRDPNALTKNEGEFDHHIWSMYDPYNWADDFTGFRGVLSGRRILAIPYGYEQMEGVEKSLKIRQKSRGYPSGIIFDYAKTASQTYTEIGYQEGLTTTWGDPDEGAQNKDADDNKAVASMRTFDLRHAHEFQGDGAVAITGAPKVVSFAIPYGTGPYPDDENDPGYRCVYDKYPQGRYHGVAFQQDRSDRKRRTGTLYLWKRPLAGGDWVLTAFSSVPDRFGRWRLGPDKEKDWYYGVNDSNTAPPAVGSEFRNREYVWYTITIPSADKYVCSFAQIPKAFAYTFYTDGGIKHVYSAPLSKWFSTHISQAAYTQPKQDSLLEDVSPSGYVDSNGRIRLFFSREGALWRGTSPNWGTTWAETVATAVTSADHAYVFKSLDGILQNVLYVNGDELHHALSQDHLSTLASDVLIATGADPARPCGYQAPDGGLRAFVLASGLVYRWTSLANGLWTSALTPLTDLDSLSVIMSYDGTRQHAFYSKGGVLYHASSHDHLTSLDEETVVAATSDASQVSGYDGAQELYCFGFVSSVLNCWKSLNRGRTWSLVGAVE